MRDTKTLLPSLSHLFQSLLRRGRNKSSDSLSHSVRKLAFPSWVLNRPNLTLAVVVAEVAVEVRIPSLEGVKKEMAITRATKSGFRALPLPRSSHESLTIVT
jgi:hypothetical protein